MENNKYKIIFVFIIFVVIIIGGFILTQISIKEKNEKDSPQKMVQKEEVTDIRIDKTKDFIYFTNETLIGDNLDIGYKDIVFNFKEDSNLANTLNDETINLKETVKKQGNELGGISYAEYKTYEIYEYDNYLSLVVSYYKYDKESLVIPINSKTYNFNKNNGFIINNNDLLGLFQIDETKMVNNTKKYIEGLALLRTDIKIDVNQTMNLLKEYPLYINKIGKLNVRVLVKNDQNDYNEDVVLS
ncbi:MAG: hypothetical protein GX951_04195 [Mollicutes bacterium]|nr:hypothetical protein [Mollicutes bacterium]